MGEGGYLPATLTARLHFCFQIRRHPSFKRFFYKVSDSSLRKLAATLHSQKARSPELGRNLTKRPYQLAFGFTNKFASNNSHAVFSLMGLCYSHASYTHFPYREAQQVRKSQTAQAKTSSRSQQDPLTVLSPPLLSSTLACLPDGSSLRPLTPLSSTLFSLPRYGVMMENLPSRLG